MEIRYQDYSAKRPYGSINKTDTHNEKFQSKDGYFVFEYGVVLIYQSQFREKDKWKYFVSLSFYHNGRGYYKTITGKEYTDLGLLRKAGEFGRYVIDKINEEKNKKKFAHNLETIMNIHKLTLKDISSLSSIPESRLKEISTSKKEAKMKEVCAIARGIGIKVDYFFFDM